MKDEKMGRLILVEKWTNIWHGDDLGLLRVYRPNGEFSAASEEGGGISMRRSQCPQNFQPLIPDTIRPYVFLSTKKLTL